MKRTQAPLSFFLLLLVVGIAGPSAALSSDLPRPSQAKRPDPGQLNPGQKVRLVQSYGRMPLSFEANQGQTDSRVRFLARGGGYTIFLTDDEAVLTLRKSQPSQFGMGRLGKFGLSNWLRPFGLVDPHAGRWPSLADDLNPMWRSLIPNLGQLVPEPNSGKGGVAAGIEFQSPQVVRMRLAGGNAKARVIGLDELPGRNNYFIGNDPKKWRTNVPSDARVKYEGVYPGVDLVYYGNQRDLEYDFVVAPGADPNQIKLSFAGADGMRVDAASGDLVLKVGDDEVRFHKPAVYQPALAAVSSPPSPFVGAARLEARHSSLVTRHSSFVLASNNEVAFRVARYDPKRTLVIDPVLSYSTYLGGSSADQGVGIAVDSSGNAYVSGFTQSTDFPTANSLQANPGGTEDAFVTKLNPSGSALVYSTYLGGSGQDIGFGIAVDSSGSAYLTGYTSSTNFPTMKPLQASLDGTQDAFVAKLNPAGSALVYSTYLGGSDIDVGNWIAVDSSGNAYLTGYTRSTNFPTVNPLQATLDGTQDAFVAKLNLAGSALVYSTYLGGSGVDLGFLIAVDSSRNAYVSGYTSSTDFPTVNPLQESYGGGTYDGFVAKLNPAGSVLVYSTYLGGRGVDVCIGIAVDSSGNAYLTGYTSSTNFPTLKPLQATLDGTQDAFVAKLNPAGSALVYSTYLGGSGVEIGEGIAVDSFGSAYVTGYTSSTDFPTVNPLQASYGGGFFDAYLAKLNPAGSALVYSTYGGGGGSDYGRGIAVDSSGNVYVTGGTLSNNFPTSSGAFQQCTTDTCAHFPGNYIPFISPYSIEGSGQVLVGQTTPAFYSGLAMVPLPNMPGPEAFCEEPVQLAPGVSQNALVPTAAERQGDFSSYTFQLTNPITGQPFPNNIIPLDSGVMGWPLGGGFTTPAGDAFVAKIALFRGPEISLSSRTLVFGPQPVHTTSTPSTLTLRNLGNAPLAITAITISANFAQGNTCRNAVPVGGHCTIYVTFTPGVVGRISGTLTINDNAANAPKPQTISLFGLGIVIGRFHPL